MLGYDEDVEATMSDSDDDDDFDDSIIHGSTASPRNVRRAESLEGPYSLLSLPLPSDKPDSGRRGSDQESPERSSYSATSGRSPRSLDQRLDELLAKEGKLGDGMSPPSSASDQQSDVEDSLSEEELDIIKLRKPVTVTLQPGPSKTTHSMPPQPKPSDQPSPDQQSPGPRGTDHVKPAAEVVAPLTDDMVDQIVRMKPMIARATRQPLQSAASNSPEDLSLKTHQNLPVNYSSEQCSSEKLSASLSSDITLSSICTTVSTFTSSRTSVSAPSSTVLTPRSSSSHQSAEVQGGPNTITNLPSSMPSGDVQVKSHAMEKRTEKVTTLPWPSVMPPVPSVSSIQQCGSSSASDNSVITRSADESANCPKRASDQHLRPLLTDTMHSTMSRYQQFLSFPHNMKPLKIIIG